MRAAAVSNPCEPLGEADQVLGVDVSQSQPRDACFSPSEVGDSTQAMQDFAASEWCDWAIAVLDFAAPLSTQSCAIPDASSLLSFLTSSWGDQIQFAESLEWIPELHAAASYELRSTPRLRDLPLFRPTTFHLFSDGSFTPPASIDGVSTPAIAGWGFVVLADDGHGSFAFVGGVGDCIRDVELVLPGFDYPPSRSTGAIWRSALLSEYAADVFCPALGRPVSILCQVRHSRRLPLPVAGRSGRSIMVQRASTWFYCIPRTLDFVRSRCFFCPRQVSRFHAME